MILGENWTRKTRCHKVMTIVLREKSERQMEEEGLRMLCKEGHRKSARLDNTLIIIITRPKPAYGRQGLAGSWGKDTDEVSTFLVFLTSHFAPVAKNHGNQSKTMKNHETTLKNH